MSLSGPSLLLLRLLLACAVMLGGESGHASEYCNVDCKNSPVWATCMQTCEQIHGDRRSAKFGAIALSPGSGAYGFSYDYGSRGEAEGRAMGHCRAAAKGRKDCKVGVWFTNACGALARRSDGGWGADWGNSRQEAARKALRNCGAGCKLEETVCNSG